MANLEALRERVAKATKSDRELDVALAVTLDPDIGTPVQRRELARYANASGIRTAAEDYDIPRYTASVDAALSLFHRALPEWWGSIDIGDQKGNPFRAHLRLGENAAQVHGEGHTIPLAILKALLSALIPSSHEGE